MGFPRQEYWNGLPFPSPGDLPNPGIKPTFPALAKHNSALHIMLLQQSEQPLSFQGGSGQGQVALAADARKPGSPFILHRCVQGGGGRGQSQGGPYPMSPLWWLCWVGMTLPKRRWVQVTEVVCGRAERTPRTEWHSLVVAALLLLENILEWAEWWRQASVISIFWRKWKLREVNYMRSRTWVAPALTGVPPTPHSTLQDCSHGPCWVTTSRNMFWRY